MLNRDFKFDADINNDTLTFSVASSAPYTRYEKRFGEYDEVLIISPESVDFTRLTDGRSPLLLQHNENDQIGVVDEAFIEDGKLYAKVTFSKSAHAQEILQDIRDGIRRNVSIGYVRDSYEMDTSTAPMKPTMNVTRFTIYEVSIVSSPADVTVGIGRSLEIEDNADMNDDEKEKEKPEAEGEKTPKPAEKPAENTEETPKEAPKAEEEKKAETCPKCGKSPCECDKEEKAQEAEEDKAEARAQEDAEIRALGELTQFETQAEEFIKGQRSLDDFKAYIKNANEGKKTNKKDISMKFKLTKALWQATKECHVDCSETIETKLIEENKRKFNITDADVVITRDQLTRGFPDGSEALNQVVYQPGMYTPNLRPESVIAKTGARAVAVTGPSISFSVATSGINAGFVDLNGSIPSADMAWSLKTMTPKKVGAYVQIDYKALLQDDPSVENIITDDIVKGVDQALDIAAICGTGTNNEPTGVYNQTGVNTVTVPATWTLSTAYAFEKAIRDSNDFSDDLHWVMNSELYYKLATTPYSSTALNEFLIDKNRKMIGYPVVICNALPASGVILGNFNELLIANFEALKLKVVEDAALSRKQAVEVQAFAAADILCRRPTSFTKGA